MTKLQKLRNWLKEPLTKKQVKIGAFILAFCACFDLLTAVLGFASKHILLGMIYICFALIPACLCGVFIYGLKNFFKEEK